VSGPGRRSLALAVQAMGGDWLGGAPLADDAWFAGAATDSRAVGKGRLFFALKGERVDGFDYCAAVAAAGAAAVVVPRDRGLPAGCGAPVIGVEDPRRALADLARAVRAQFRGQVVGITGSNGKTTTKELVAAALDVRAVELGQPSGEVLRTAGNYNTEIGMPLTLLESSGDEAFWVLEMAMRARGEIALLADIARPHVGLVTNVAAAHLGRLGSLAEVARAKGEIYGGLLPDGIGILPADEPLLEAEAAILPEARKRRFAGLDAASGDPATRREADVRLLELISAGAAGSVLRFAAGETPVVVRLPLPGDHNARNAAAALAVVLALGRPIAPAAEAMQRVVLPTHRSQLLTLAGRLVLDDCYNANPASMAAALRTIAGSVPGQPEVAAGPRAFAVLGDMLELGPQEEALHHEIGELVAQLGLAGLVTVGPLALHYALGAKSAGMPAEQVASTDDPAQAAAIIARWSRPGDWVLVKASRGLRLERVIDALGPALANVDVGGAAPAGAP
jgi:UDP-N-acetylmuramoyl-tripeptide--D-alanyl-D-alanine ligase